MPDGPLPDSGLPSRTWVPKPELHPDLTNEEVAWILREGVEVFNSGEFFESHEYFEEIWRSTNPEPRDLFQGLVQVAAAFYIWLHRGKSEPAGRMLARGVGRLRPLGVTMGVDVPDLLERLEPWGDWLRAPEGEAPELPRVRRHGA